MPKPFPFRKIAGLTKEQQHQLWRNFAALAKRSEPFTWGSVGDVVVATAGVYRVRTGGPRLVADVDLTAALTGTTTVLVKKNGSTVATVTVASGATHGTASAEVRTIPGDLITIESTAVGTGSAMATTTVEILD